MRALGSLPVNDPEAVQTGFDFTRAVKVTWLDDGISDPDKVYNAAEEKQCYLPPVGLPLER